MQFNTVTLNNNGTGSVSVLGTSTSNVGSTVTGDPTSTSGAVSLSGTSGTNSSFQFQSGISLTDTSGNLGVTGILGDTAAKAYTGALAIPSTVAAATANVAGSPYAISIGHGSLASLSGYAFGLVITGQITINPAPVTVTALDGSS